MDIWDDVVTKLDKEIYRKAGFRVDTSVGTKGLGANPALLIIDVTYGFVGDKPEPITKSVERFPLSCGDRGEVSHKVNLFDMNSKYASVVSVAQAKGYLSKIAGKA